MTSSTHVHGMDGPFNLGCFLQVHQDDYNLALSEIKSSRKRSPWMWYIFPYMRHS